jgi:hypothetical protein
MNAACSLSTKKVHPALKKLVQEHAEILSPMYAESAVCDLCATSVSFVTSVLRDFAIVRCAGK